MKRRKLPAYGKQLARDRAVGRHPDLIWIFFGDDWGRRPHLDPCLCVRPEEYAPGVYDWSICAGVTVHVVERTRVDAESRDALRLAAEVAEITAPVIFHWVAAPGDWPNPAGRPAQDHIDDLMRSQIKADKTIRLGFPPYWSRSKDEAYTKRRLAMMESKRADISGKLERLGNDITTR